MKLFNSSTYISTNFEKIDSAYTLHSVKEMWLCEFLNKGNYIIAMAVELLPCQYNVRFLIVRNKLTVQYLKARHS